MGANEPTMHLRGVETGRDSRSSASTSARVEAGDTVDGKEIRIEPAIEIGNIFKLGTRYCEPLGATYLDENGKEQPISMGSYGIGPARIAAAAVEQFADEKGIAWPKAIAPLDVEVVALGKPGTPEREAADGLYRELQRHGHRGLLDDRAAGPGEKFADAELLGVPLRLTVGERSLESGERRSADAPRAQATTRAACPLAEAAEAVQELWPSMPRSAAATRGTVARAGGRGMAEPAADLPAPLRPGPLGSAAAPDAQRRAVERLDDPQRDRLRAPRADPGRC